MRKLVFGISALALAASGAASAADGDPGSSAGAEAMTPSFTRMDADADGRVSAIEAANNSRVAAGFTAADVNKDGYLSKEEYAQLERASSSTGASPRSSTTTSPEVPGTVPAPK